MFAIVARSFRVQPGALIAEWAHLKSDDRSERVRLGRTAALEGEVRLTLSHLGGCWIRGAVVDERTAHALDLSLETSRAAKRLILPVPAKRLILLGKRVAEALAAVVTRGCCCTEHGQLF